MITLEAVMANKAIETYINKSDKYLEENIIVGYDFSRHGKSHVLAVAETAGWLLDRLGYTRRETELAKIAAYMHDIGNLINRDAHAQSGAMMTFVLLNQMGMPAEDIADIVTAIGNHDESNGVPATPVTAALILADKTDMGRGRLRGNPNRQDAFSSSEYAVASRSLKLEAHQNLVLDIVLDIEWSSVTEFIQMLALRWDLCQNAAKRLGCTFECYINHTKVY